MNKEEVTHLYNNFYSLNKAPRKRRKKRNYRILKTILNQIPLGAFILDVGCGPGHLIRALQTAAYRVTGTEISEWAIDNLLSDLDVVKVFINDMSIFADNTFDCVVCSDVLEHLQTEEEAEKSIKEMVRITKKSIILTASSKKSLGKDVGDAALPDRNTHTLIKPPEWWVNLFKSNFKVIEKGKAGSSLFVYGEKERC